MANSYFEFKEFTIQQSDCAMKVCTDACLFGAWAADYLQMQKNKAGSILDIGSGTGLLSIMLAQTTNAVIDGVEIEENAAKQAAVNAASSPWNNQITIQHNNIQQYAGSSSNQYDFIISNPPFFEHDLKSTDESRNLALHSKALTLNELTLIINSLLKPNGHFAVLLPYTRGNFFKTESLKAGFYLHQEVLVKQTPRHSPFRSMLLFGRTNQEALLQEMIIKENNEYTPEFRKLLTPYYLPF
jgi:tRNA1Val (adenine37-N6)-methyltransferase